MLLGDYGAEVVKVEPPDGDPARALAGFAVWNRNKQSIVVDQCTEAGRTRLAAVVDGAGASNPGLVRLAMPPFADLGEGGAPWAGGAESHELLTALGGPSS